ncbi:MAG: c-type cytochrome [Gemmatimonadales bacterium]
MFKQLLLPLALVTAAPGVLMAQGGFRWPDKAQNLKALPPETGGQRLSQIMRGFTGALGVRCEYCHKGQGGDLSQFDFVSDEKPAKEKARLMIKMVQAINGTHLAGLADLGVAADRRVSVTCTTCHRGIAKPMTLDAVLAETIEAEGADAAVNQYQQLRGRYYGSAAYDFSRGVLTNLGERLSQAGKNAEAVKMVELELSANGEDFRTLASLGGIQVRAGDKDKGLATLKKALDLAPDNAKQFIQNQIDRASRP